MKNQRIITAIATLCEAFNRTASPATYAAYEIGLNGIAPEAVERAIAICLQRMKFMPAPAEIREIAVTAGGSYETVANQAFTVLQNTVRRLGADYSVNFEDGAINAAVRRLGGWQKCCDQSPGQFDVWYRKSFLAAYIAIIREGATEDERRYHAGRMAGHNAAWEGKMMPGGGTFESVKYGTEIRTIGSDKYQPALPAPAPQERKSLAAKTGVGLELKLIGRQAS